MRRCRRYRDRPAPVAELAVKRNGSSSETRRRERERERERKYRVPTSGTKRLGILCECDPAYRLSRKRVKKKKYCYDRVKWRYIVLLDFLVKSVYTDIAYYRDRPVPENMLKSLDFSRILTFFLLWLKNEYLRCAICY